MNPFDMGNLGNLGGLMAGFQQKMADIKQQAAETEVRGEAGGMVEITMTCDYNVHSIRIDDKAMADRELLEDLLRAALNEALRKAKDETSRTLSALTAGLPIPPGLL